MPDRLRRPRLLAALFLAATGQAAAASPPRGACPPAAARSAPVAAARFSEGPMIQPAQLRADLETWMAWMRATNPDLSVRANLARVERMRARIAASIDRPMSRRQAWLLLARLNPVLQDGHNSILPPDYRQRVRDHLAGGGRILPFEAHIADDNSLRVRRILGDVPGLSAGDRILAVNGRSAGDIVGEALAVTEGDTPAFRRALASRRFAFLYWSLFGDTGTYAIVAAGAGPCPRHFAAAGSAEFPAPNGETEYSYEILAGDVGYLRAGSFDGEYRDAFLAFARRAFAAFRARGIRALIIDVRDNRGGDDPLWQEGLMNYIADRPYAHVGRYAVRVTAENSGPGDVVGSVQRQIYTRRFMPPPDNPLRFAGPVYILKGPLTYSAAVQFLVAAQDFSIARIAGSRDGALSCQTGRVRAITLPHSGLEALTPILSFVRPSGTGCDRPVVPDVAIDDDGLNPRRAVDLLAARIRAGR